MSKFELGVISGKEIGVVFSDAKYNNYALPAVNVSNTSTVMFLKLTKSQLSSNRTILKWGVSIFCRKRII